MTSTVEETRKITESIRKYEGLLGDQPRYSSGEADLTGLSYFDLVSYFEYLVKLYNN